MNPALHKEYTMMDIEKIEYLISALDQAITRFDSECQRTKTNSAYMVLQSSFLDNGFIDSYDGNIDNLVSIFKQEINILKNILDNMTQIDLSISDDIPEEVETEDKD